MTHKQQIIQSIKQLNFNELSDLLDDRLSYMEVSKKLFLEKLESRIDDYIKGYNITEFNTVIKGACGSCKMNCEIYSFKIEEVATLNLLFVEKDHKVVDIKLCNKPLINGIYSDDYTAIYFSFYEDEKISFKPNSSYLNIQKHLNSAVNLIAQYKTSPIKLKTITKWLADYKKYENINSPLNNNRYRAFEVFSNLYSDLNGLKILFENNYNSIMAIKVYEAITNEKQLLKWLITYKSVGGSFKYNKHSEHTTIVDLRGLKILVANTECLDALKHKQYYSSNFEEMIKKYTPSIETINSEKQKGRFSISLENFLRLQNKHLDILD